MRLGTTELLIILAVVLILFGPSQIPKLTRMFKKSSDNFKEGVEEAKQEKIAKNAADADQNDYREV